MTTTYDLNADELVNLLVDSVYPDAKIDCDKAANNESTYYILHSPETMSHAYVWTTPHTIVGLTKTRYDELISEAREYSYTPLIIVGTPDGVFEFNMDVLKVEWEPYSDGDKPDILVTDLALSTGKGILPFYPDFSSEEEYLDTLMSDEPGDDW